MDNSTNNLDGSSLMKRISDMRADPAWRARRTAFVEIERRQFWRTDVPVACALYLAVVIVGTVLSRAMAPEIPLLQWLCIFPVLMAIPAGYLLSGLYPRFD